MITTSHSLSQIIAHLCETLHQSRGPIKVSQAVIWSKVWPAILMGNSTK